MNGFRVAFAGLLLVAAATSVLAGWGLVGSSLLQSRTSVTTSSASLSTSYTTVASQSSETSSAQSASSTTSTTSTGEPSTSTATATATQTATTTVTATSVSTTTAVGGGVSTTTVTTTTAVVTTTLSGAASTTTVVGSSTTSQTSATASLGGLGSALSSGGPLLKDVQDSSLLLAPVCWILLGGMWAWRGRVRARYSEMGFGSDVFELFMKMKGGATRIKVLNTLATPKDRLQLAEELGVDWKTIDRHVQILNKYGFVKEQAAYGTVRLYEVTPMGKMLLNLFDDLERTDGPTARAPPTSQAERPQG